MRACFLAQNVCALGNGFAILQTQPLSTEALEPKSETVPGKDEDNIPSSSPLVGPPAKLDAPQQFLKIR